MERIETEYLKERLDTLELNTLEFPKQLDRILYEDETEDEIEYEDLNTWIDKAEKWDRAPREAVFIPDYWGFDEGIEQRMAENIDRELQSPGLEGVRLATNAIQAQREKGPTGFSAVIGLEMADIDDSVQRYQLGSPQGDTEPVRLPEWFQNDDWFSDLEEDGKVGVVVDDHTVYARYIMDNTRLRENDVRSFDDRFWDAYEETIESYTGF